MANQRITELDSAPTGVNSTDLADYKLILDKEGETEAVQKPITDITDELATINSTLSDKVTESDVNNKRGTLVYAARIY